MGENVIAASRLSNDCNCPQIRQTCPQAVSKAPGSVQHILSIAARIRLFANCNHLTLAAQG
jgi:hypothetical protein